MIYDEINKKITGRLALLSAEEADALYRITAIPGDHVDLGTLWGGTAVLAALAKQRAEAPGHIYTIDFMRGGYWATGDPSRGGLVPSEATIHQNLSLFGISGRVTVIKAPSHPWPLPEDVLPTSVLIDCDHSYEGCLRDWNKVRSLTPLFVAFHDYNAKTHPGVAKVVDEIASRDDQYRLIEQAGTLIIFELKPPEPAVNEPVVSKPAAQKTKANPRGKRG